MAMFNLVADKFKDVCLNFNRKCQEPISELDLIRCVWTVGARDKQELDQQSNEHNHSIICDALSCVFRLDWTTHQTISYASFYKELDASVQRCSSYWYGMAFAKLVSERVMDITWLAHVHRMIKARIVIPSLTVDLRPDLVGNSFVGWHVLEGKCLTTYGLRSTYNDAKDQLRGVYQIDNKPPVSRSVSIAQIMNKKTSVYLIDPDDDEEQTRVSLEIDLVSFLRKYYSATMEFVLSNERHRKQVGSKVFLSARLPMLSGECWVAFQEDLLHVSGLEKVPALSWIRDIPLERRSTDEYSLGIDGIIVYKGNGDLSAISLD